MKRDEFDLEINTMLSTAESFIPEENLPDLPCMELAPTVPDWYDFELKLWDMGEDIRRLILSEHKELNANQTDRVCNICADARAKRGRQSFVMLLGKKRYLHYAQRIASVLTDEDVVGHVISTLYKMGASQYTEQIKPYTNHTITWIKNEAKRYVQKYEV